jgi:hypothetical protein
VRRLRYAVALVVVVDFLVAVVQMQQAIIERASFQRPSVTTFGQFAVTMTSRTSDDIDLYVRDPQGDIAWYGSLQAGALARARHGSGRNRSGQVRRARADDDSRGDAG